MKRLLIIAVTLAVSGLMSTANAATFTWTNVQDGYFAPGDFVWVSGSVTSDGGETAGEDLGMNCPFHSTGGTTTVNGDHSFNVAAVSPVGSGPYTWTIVIYDSNDNLGTNAGVAN